MRAVRVLAHRPERAINALTQLCEERTDIETIPPPSIFIAPTLSSIPPQTPYTIGSHSTLQARVPVPVPITKPAMEHPSPSQPTAILEPKPKAIFLPIPNRSPPEHMAPRRSLWTSPPPPEAPDSEHTLYRDQMDHGLELATASTDARELEDSFSTTSSESELYFSDDGMVGSSDAGDSVDERSVISLTEGSQTQSSFHHQPRWSDQDDVPVAGPSSSLVHSLEGTTTVTRYARMPSRSDDKTSVLHGSSVSTNSRRHEGRRSSSGPPRTSLRPSWHSKGAPLAALLTPLSKSPLPTMSDLDKTPSHDVFDNTSQPRLTKSPVLEHLQLRSELPLEDQSLITFDDELRNRGRTPTGSHTPTASSYVSSTCRPKHAHTDSESTVMSKKTPTKKSARGSWMWTTAYDDNVEPSIEFRSALDNDEGT